MSLLYYPKKSHAFNPAWAFAGVAKTGEIADRK
jgi:hypothetical protein